jgi:hypothetical protein
MPMPTPKKKAAKSKPIPAPAPSGLRTIGIKSTREWAAWLDRYAKSQRVTIASLIDRALAADAERNGFEAPPERVP